MDWKWGVAGWIMGPKIILSSSLGPVNVTLSSKRTFVYVIKVKILRWRDYRGLTRWALNEVLSVLIRQRQREIPLQRRRSEGDWRKMLHCWLWRWRPRTRNAALENGKGKEMDCPLNSGGIWPSWPFEFRSVTLISNFWLPTLWKNKLSSFPVARFLIFLLADTEH